MYINYQMITQGHVENLGYGRLAYQTCSSSLQMTNIRVVADTMRWLRTYRLSYSHAYKKAVVWAQQSAIM